MDRFRVFWEPGVEISTGASAPSFLDPFLPTVFRCSLFLAVQFLASRCVRSVDDFTKNPAPSPYGEWSHECDTRVTLPQIPSKCPIFSQLFFVFFSPKTRYHPVYEWNGDRYMGVTLSLQRPLSPPEWACVCGRIKMQVLTKR